MSQEPWKDWIPGVLSESQIKDLINAGCITGVQDLLDSIGSSSIDLRLTNEAYEMPEGSVKPSGSGYLHNIKKERLANKLEPNQNGEFRLDKKKVYLFKLAERLERLKNVSIFGQATAKSTIGRVDVLARLIVDGMDCYESFNPNGFLEGSGDMFIEIIPITFNVKVKSGLSLSQLRLCYGDFKNSVINGQDLYDTILQRDDGSKVNGSLSVDLTNTTIDNSNETGCAFCGKKDIETFIKLWTDGEHDKLNPKDFWDLMKSDNTGRIIIREELFYIIRSKEKISLPPGVAVYCRASDETIGEMRIHYAGFVHPYFGIDIDKKIKKPTPLIFEVRGHNVNVNLKDGEKMATLTFYRMSKDSKKEDDSYTGQGLKLSKIFNEWK